MKNKYNNYSHNENVSVNVNVNVPSRPSLFKTLEGVKAQVEYECFAETGTGASGKQWTRIDPLCKELCLIIAEVYVMPPERLIRIRGAEMEAGIVQEVYRELTHEHIDWVAMKFKEQGHKIHRKTAYLQTSLYNVLFEMDAGITNDLRASGLIGAPGKKNGGM